MILVKHLCAASALAAAFSAPGAALAQANEPSASGGAENQGEDEIIVYGQKTGPQSLQTVPSSISAVTAKLLDEANVNNVQGVGNLIPNVQLDTTGTFPGYANFWIRGVGVNASNRTIDPAVNIFQDGMVIGYPAGAVLDTFDLDGVEVLRGPQGVLFGRNSSGGAVVLRTRKPTDTVEGHLNVRLGNFDSVDVSASVGGPIVADKILAKIAILSRNSSGYYKVTNGGTFVPAPLNPSGLAPIHPEGRHPKTHELIIKPTVLFKLSDAAELTLYTQYQRYDDGGGAPRAYVPENSTNPGAARLLNFFGFTPPKDPYEVNIAELGHTRIRAGHAIANLDWEIGEGTLTAIAAYRKVKYNATISLDGSPFRLFIIPDNPEQHQQESLEVRYAGSIGSNLKYLVGAYLYADKMHLEEKRELNGPLNGRPVGTTINFRSETFQKLKTAAIFANVDYEVSPGLTVTVGARGSTETKDFRMIPLTPCAVLGPGYNGCGTIFTAGKKNWKNFSPRAIISYKPNDTAMVYASYSRGFRSGNYNARATKPVEIGPANPETVTTYELGLKTQPISRLVRFNVTGFYSKYNDIQRVVQQGLPNGQIFQSLTNAATATIKGLEVETYLSPLAGLSFNGSVGYTDAKYDSFVAGLPAGVVGTKLKFERVPKWTAHIDGMYTTNVPSLSGSLSARASYTYRSHVFTDLLNSRELEQKAYGILDASITYDRGAWSLSVFGRNLADKHYAEINSISFTYAHLGGIPRTYGVELGYSF